MDAELKNLKISDLFKTVEDIEAGRIQQIDEFVEETPAGEVKVENIETPDGEVSEDESKTDDIIQTSEVSSEEEETPAEETIETEEVSEESASEYDDETAAEIAALTSFGIGSSNVVTTTVETSDVDEETQADLDYIKNIAGI